MVCLPCDPGQIVGPGVVFVLRWRNRCPSVPKRRKLPSGPRTVISGGWSKKRIGRRHAQGRGGRRAVAAGALHRAREAHARLSFTRRLAEDGSEVHAGHVVRAPQRLRRARARHHRRARDSPAENRRCGTGRWWRDSARAESVFFGVSQIVAIDQVLVLVVSGGQAVGGEAEPRVGCRW